MREGEADRQTHRQTEKDSERIIVRKRRRHRGRAR